MQSTNYSKQKEVLKIELLKFLSQLKPSKDLSSAVTSDVRMFLVYKEKNGKTIVHNTGCKFIGKLKDKSNCDSPLRRSAGSVDSLIGQVRAIFRDYGRGSEWNDTLGLGNPAAVPIVKRYLAAMRLEQSTTATLPKRAPPLFRNKLFKVSRHISYKLCNPHLSIVHRYILQRDLAFLNLLANTGDRAGDLGALLVDQICMLPANEGVMLNITKGKIQIFVIREWLLC